MLYIFIGKTTKYAAHVLPNVELYDKLLSKSKFYATNAMVPCFEILNQVLIIMVISNEVFISICFLFVWYRILVHKKFTFWIVIIISGNRKNTTSYAPTHKILAKRWNGLLHYSPIPEMVSLWASRSSE